MGLLSRLRLSRSRGEGPGRRPPRVRPLPGAPVEVQIMGSNSLDILLARDISIRGVGVLVPHRFEGCDIDSRVELVVTLPGTRSFLATGTVRHRTREDEPSAIFGIEFHDLSRANRERVRAYVEGLESLS